MRACKPPIDFAMEQVGKQQVQLPYVAFSSASAGPLAGPDSTGPLGAVQTAANSADNSYVAATAAASSAAAASSGSGPGAGGVTPGPAAAGTLQQYVSAIKDLGHASTAMQSTHSIVCNIGPVAAVVSAKASATWRWFARLCASMPHNAQQQLMCCVTTPRIWGLGLTPKPSRIGSMAGTRTRTCAGLYWKSNSRLAAWMHRGGAADVHCQQQEQGGE
jgi:hypothetical protein